jgi:predicted metal-dependent phosphoesterase TrpH
MIKTELHAHTDGDLADRIAHSAEALIDRASALGYGALAITLHDRWTDPAPFRDYAAERGLVILSGIERSIERKHVLIINGPKDAQRLKTFADLRAYRAANPSALVVAPHAFYPIPSALGALLDRHPDLFDALEVNAMRVKGVDFNTRAMAWASAHGKPLVGNSDLHILSQLGTTYSMVDASEPSSDAICEAIKRGRVEVVSTPLNWFRAGWLFARMVFNGGRKQP